ncbi:DUF4270 family protein [Flammeovirgaceae bacterium SG7u.111]|nr:DUF4270 family protein [Flammeovirgaceae bacterium SG7u.132]WPO38417.1 DUF4270 family protein [Flammeovirgaceae bacterium SG7u.111]
MNKQNLIKIAFSISLAMSLLQCTDPTQIGNDIVERELLDVVFIDTISLGMSTIIISDSLNTANSSRHLIGYVETENIGSMQSKAYFKFQADSVENYPDEDARYKYAEFELVYDGYFYHDTTQEFSLSFHAMKEELELDEDDALYNTSTFPYEQTPLGELIFKPQPRRQKSLLVPLDESFAQAFFEYAQATDEGDFIEDFYDNYPGFVIEADTNYANCFLGFSTQSKLTFHYRRSGEDLEFTIPSSGLNFNQISNDRSNTELKDLLTSTDAISSKLTDRQSYMNDGVGMGIKINFPSLTEVKEILSKNIVIDAVLVLKPVQGTYGNYRPLPTNLTFYEIDKKNRILQELSLVNTLYVDEEFGEATEYRIDITEYIKSKVEQVGEIEEALYLKGGNETLGLTVNQLTLGDSENKYKSHLELLILDYSIEN